MEYIWVVEVAAVIALSFILYQSAKWLLKHKKVNPSERILAIIALSSFLLSYGAYWYYEELTSFDDEYMYYINLFEGEETAKNYRVPGEISISDDGIHLFSVSWPNGGSTYFENSYYIVLEEGKRIEIKDDEDRVWFAELTKIKADR